MLHNMPCLYQSGYRIYRDASVANQLATSRFVLAAGRTESLGRPLPLKWRFRVHLSVFLNDEINRLEKKFLELIQYNVAVKSNLYAKYYFELRALFKDNTKEFPLVPLDK